MTRTLISFLKSQDVCGTFLIKKNGKMKERNLFKCPACDGWLKLEGFKIGTNGVCYLCRARVMPHGEMKTFLMIGLILAIKFKALLGELSLFGERKDIMIATALSITFYFTGNDDMKLHIDLSAINIGMFHDKEQRLCEHRINSFVMQMVNDLNHKELSKTNILALYRNEI